MPIDIRHDTDLRIFAGQVKVQATCQGCLNSKGKPVDHGTLELIVEDLYINEDNYCRWLETSGRLINEGGKMVRYPSSQQERVGYLGQCKNSLVYVNGECLYSKHWRRNMS